MKKLIYVILMGIVCISINFAQEENDARGINVYTFFVNIVNDQFRFPLIGFVNIAGGNNTLPQIGFINLNQNNFQNLQLGFVNTIGGSMNGAQIGFVNTIAGEHTKGFQLGFVNVVKNLNGFQLGFVNYADSIDNGIPVGFISIVRNGGYKAIELSINEIAPLNIAFKIGVEKFYTSIIVSYNFMESEIGNAFFNGLGIGTIIPINHFLFFNPELVMVFDNRILGNNQNYLSFAPNIGFKIFSGLSILVSPSITWTYTFDRELSDPFFSIYNHKINDNNVLLIGARFALRYEW